MALRISVLSRGSTKGALLPMNYAYLRVPLCMLTMSPYMIAKLSKFEFQDRLPEDKYPVKPSA